VWVPHIAIARIRAPVTVVIQIFITDDIVRDVSRGTRVLVAAVASVAPVIEVVGRTEILEVRIQRIRAAEGGTLAGVERVGLPVASRFPFSFPHADDSIVSVFAGFDPVASGLEDGESLIGRVDLKDIVTA